MTINHTVYIVSPDGNILFFIADAYKANAVSDIFSIHRTKLKKLPNLLHTAYTFFVTFSGLVGETVWPNLHLQPSASGKVPGQHAPRPERQNFS